MTDAMRFERRTASCPGFGLTLGFTLFYLCLVVLIPLAALALKAASLRVGRALGRRRPRPASSPPTGSPSAPRSPPPLVNAVFGLLVAWVLVRYRFPGRRLVDALVDLPFALPTAVAGIALTTLYAETAGSAGPSPRSASRSPSRRSASASPSPSSACPSSCARCSRCSRRSTPRSRRPRRASARAALQTFLRVVLPAIAPGLAHRLRPRLRPRARRVRLGRLHLRQHADEDRDRPAPHHDQARAVRLRRRHRDRRDPARRVLPAPAARSTCSRPGARAAGRVE